MSHNERDIMPAPSQNGGVTGGRAMKTILGIDIGGTTTKIVGLDHTGTLLSTLRVQAEDPLTSLYGAFGSYLSGTKLTLADVSRVVLTGVGASYVEGDIYGLPTCTVDRKSVV